MQEQEKTKAFETQKQIKVRVIDKCKYKGAGYTSEWKFGKIVSQMKGRT